MKRIGTALLALAVATAFVAVEQSAAAETCAQKKKRRRRPKAEDPPKEPAQAPADDAAKAAEEESARAREAEEKARADEERRRVEEAKRKLELEGRKKSQVTPGTASRWSNKGAMTPIVSEVPITAPLPKRAVPIAAGAETPGQNLIGAEELLQLRVALYGYHLQTRGQDFVYQGQIAGARTTTLVQDADRDIDIFRTRASLAYLNIAGSDIGTHLDLEYRSRAAGARPTDYRINELYLSYGITDFRGRNQDLDWGVAVGRVAVREAGYARADGAALRLRLGESFNFGAFGGFTGNPYGYNWALQETQDFSTDWINGGAFFAYRGAQFFANLAGVVTLANVGPQASGLDRLYGYFDVAYLATESIDVFLLGWVDVIGGNPFQSIQTAVAYRPNNTADFRVGLGRFSTVAYDASTAYTFNVDPLSNRGTDPNNPGIIIDENGRPIVPFDATLQTAVYNSLTLRAGYRFTREAEAFVVGEALLRDTSRTDQATIARTGNKNNFAALRMTPTLGARYRDPELLDAALEASYIADDQSQATASIRGSLGRGYAGLYAQIDARHFFGDIAGTDGGLELSYTLPRDWFPGRVMLRGMVRYFRENVAIGRPRDPAADTIDGQTLFLIPTQESYLGFAGIEWRL